MASNDVCELSAPTVKGGVPVWPAVNRLGPDPGDVEPLGDADVFQALGVSSLPFPSDDGGKAEGVILRGVGGRPAVCVGGRDTRSAAIVGNLKPGDTVLHSTGPSQAAQVQCKESKRQVVMASKDPNGKTIVINLDGGNNKIQFVLSGMVFEMNGQDKSVSITNGQCQILMQGSTICLDGDVILGGTTADPVNKIMVSALVGPVPAGCAPSGPPGILVSAAKGISVAV